MSKDSQLFLSILPALSQVCFYLTNWNVFRMRSFVPFNVGFCVGMCIDIWPTTNGLSFLEVWDGQSFLAYVWIGCVCDLYSKPVKRGTRRPSWPSALFGSFLGPLFGPTFGGFWGQLWDPNRLQTGSEIAPFFGLHFLTFGIHFGVQKTPKWANMASKSSLKYSC